MNANAEIIAELRRVLNERDEAREQLDLTKRELGRWVDREAKAVRERDEARADADRWKRSCNVFRERDWPKAFQATVTSLEREVSDAYEQLAKLRKLSKPWGGDAYRRGAEAMREACAQWIPYIIHTDCNPEEKMRALPIPEEP